MGSQADQFVSAVQKWWAQPFNAEGSAVSWFLFLGLLLVIIFAWHRILSFILEE